MEKSCNSDAPEIKVAGVKCKNPGGPNSEEYKISKSYEQGVDQSSPSLFKAHEVKARPRPEVKTSVHSSKDEKSKDEA